MANLHLELFKDIHREVYDLTDDGVYFPRIGALASGEYIDRINDGEWHLTKNQILPEGLSFLLSVALGTKARAPAFMALFSGTAAPSSTWKAASFAATANEIVSMSEGYTSPTRPPWEVPAETNTNTIDNFGSVAKVTIATASQLTISGIALLTNSTRGGTTGALLSATKYPIERVLQNGDIYYMGYRLGLTV